MNQTIRYIQSQLQGLYPDSELRDMAWWILEEVSGLTRTQLLSGCKDTKNYPDIEIILSRLRKKEPLQYIFGHTLWRGLDLRVTPATLIPRPETAELVDFIGQTLRPSAALPLRVADVGTGSGCIALALKQLFPAWQVTGFDISAEALTVARDNAERNGLSVDFRQADIFSDEIGIFDVLVSNPPYICERERAEMDATVLDYEPASALFVPDTDPLLFYRTIAEAKKAPYLFFELNEHYADATCRLLTSLGYTDTELRHDMFGKPRLLSTRYISRTTPEPTPNKSRIYAQQLPSLPRTTVEFG